MASNKSALTTNKLIDSIKRRAMIPSSNITFSDNDLIEFLNEEMNIGLIPSILQMKDEYLVFKEVVAIQPNNSIYPIPSRAIGNKLRELSYSDDGRNEYNMAQIELDNKASNNYLNQVGFYASQFYVQGSNINLHPSDFNYSGFLLFYYYMRPNYLVKDSSVAVIKDIDRTTGTITLNSLPTTYISDIDVDFVNSDSPNNIMSIDIPIISVNQLTKTVVVSPSLIPSNLKKGDYMPLAGESCIPNVPTELHSVLAQRVAMRVLESIGDTQGLTNAKAKLDEMEAKTGILVDSRVEGSPIKVKNRQMQYTLRGRFMRGTF